jgi:predicted DNA-binding transcriptional regulator AlpA
MTLKPDAIAYPPRGLSHEEAARYVGLGTTKFDELIADRRMPKPRQVDGRTIWDRVELDIAFSELPHQAQPNFFDQAMARRR